MSIGLDMVMAPKSGTALGERLARLTGEDATGCVHQYRALAQATRRSSRFAAALRAVKALSDENRLLAVALLRRRGELCACQIQAATGLSHATVSHHMATLVDAGLVKGRREGKWMYYRLREREAHVLP